MALSIVAVIIATAHRFLIAKDYDFIVEAPCDPLVDICFARDCSLPDECPPNNLENYRMFNIKAYDFEKCADNSCLNECLSGQIYCQEIFCGDSEEDACADI